MILTCSKIEHGRGRNDSFTDDLVIYTWFRRSHLLHGWKASRLLGRTQSGTTSLREAAQPASGESMNARDYLNEARGTIQDRGLDYGHPSDNMQRTAALWSAYLEMPVNDYQVAMCMALVKIARSMETAKTDTYIDLVAYTSLAAQLHTEENDLYV